MSIVIRDETMVSELREVSEPQDVVTANGGRLGRFIPEEKKSTIFPEFGITDDELLRRLNDPNTVWRTPEDVMQRLREIDQCSP